MTRFDSGLSPLFWNTLFECIRRVSELQADEKNILIASPWLSDIELYGSRWHSSMIASMGYHGRLHSLIDVLGALCELGYDVDLVLGAKKGKFLPPKSNDMVNREKVLIEMATKVGVRCSFKEDFHSKELVTPFALLTGSANWTNNGLWNLIEHLEFKHRDTAANIAEFAQERQGILDTYISATGSPILPAQVNAAAASGLHPIHQTDVINPTPSGGEAFVAFIEEDTEVGSEIMEDVDDENHAAGALLNLLEAMRNGDSNEELILQAANLLSALA